MSSPRTLAEISLSASQLMAIAEAAIRKVEKALASGPESMCGFFAGERES